MMQPDAQTLEETLVARQNLDLYATNPIRNATKP